MELEQFTKYLASCGIRKFTFELAEPAKAEQTASVEPHAIGQWVIHRALTETKPQPPERQEVREPAIEPRKVDLVRQDEQPEAELEKAAEPEQVPEQKKETVKEEPQKRKPADPYSAFLSAVENDDGTPESVTAIEEAVSALNLDGLLKANNEFGLGLDTDKSIDEIRKDVADCWKTEG